MRSVSQEPRGTSIWGDGGYRRVDGRDALGDDPEQAPHVAQLVRFEQAHDPGEAVTLHAAHAGDEVQAAGRQAALDDAPVVAPVHPLDIACPLEPVDEL